MRIRSWAFAPLVLYALNEIGVYVEPEYLCGRPPRAQARWRLFCAREPG